jgi:hypothetical protein
MSLINDALKRARDTQQSPPPPGTPLQPVEPPARGGAGWILALLSILFLGAAGYFLNRALSEHKPKPVVAVKTVVTPAPPPPPIAAPAPAISAATTATNSGPPADAVGTPPLVATTNAPAVPTVVVTWPKVQGIVFNAAEPLAVVNGQSVAVGDHVGEFQVKKITKDSVVLQRPDGTQKTLGIGD